MAPSPPRTFDSLPPELLILVFPYLSGFDLVNLSHVDKRFYTDLLGPESEHWRTRVPRTMRWASQRWYEVAKGGWRKLLGLCGSSNVATPTLPPERTAKREYVSCVSMRFPGNTGRTSAVSPRPIRHSWSRSVAPFSFDVWFTLLPTGLILSPTDRAPRGRSPPETVGGILLGAQSLHITHPDMSDVTAQFLHVDPLGNLYCSFVTGNKPVLAKLQLQRWYHLTLTLNKTTPEATNGHQRVYLDGELVDEQHGALPDFDALENIQIGNGVMDAGSVGNLRASDLRKHWFNWLAVRGKYRGKYGFNGLVDEFRFWRGVLSADDVKQLRLGEDSSVCGRVRCAWSLMRDGDVFNFYGNLSAVHCTRPPEGSCESVRFAHRLLAINDPNRIHVDRF